MMDLQGELKAVALNTSEEMFMISPRYSHYLFSFLMAFFMSCIMSLVITLFNVGLVEQVTLIWLRAWAFAFVVALPVISVVAPMVRKLVALAVRQA